MIGTFIHHQKKVCEAAIAFCQLQSCLRLPIQQGWVQIPVPKKQLQRGFGSIIASCEVQWGLAPVRFRVDQCSVLEQDGGRATFVPATGAVQRLPAVDGPRLDASPGVEKVLYDVGVAVVRGSM